MSAVFVGIPVLSRDFRTACNKLNQVCHAKDVYIEYLAGSVEYLTWVTELDQRLTCAAIVKTRVVWAIWEQSSFLQPHPPEPF